MYARLGWRNVWRNPRRTAVIVTAMTIGVWCMIFLAGAMAGMYEGMIENSLSTLTGHLQVHAPGFRTDPVVEHSMDPDPVAGAFDKVLPPGSHYAFRVRVNAVVQNARHSTAATLVGIQPEREAKVSFVKTGVTRGEYLEPNNARGILSGAALAEDFETEIGKKLILVSQGAQGEIQSRAYRIRGLFHAELEATEKQYVFVDMKSAQAMLEMGGQVSEAAVWLPDADLTPQVVKDLSAELSADRYEVADYKELMPLITASIGVWDTFMIIWYLVVFVAMGFGIVNTILMAVMERMREFGLLKALGMKPRQIAGTVLAESAVVIVLGMVLGNLFGFLSVYAVSKTGIDLSALAAGAERWALPRVIIPTIRFRDVWMADLVVIVLGLLVSLYPAMKAARTTPKDAMSDL